MTNDEPAPRVAQAELDRLKNLRARLPYTRLQERAHLSRELDRLFSHRQPGPDFGVRIEKLERAVEASASKVEALRSMALSLTYDPALPITAHHDEIAAALASHQVVVICGATGSGKTTQLPKFCLEMGRGTLGLIGHTQPRRIAARAIAARLASELGTTIGGAVGYQVRFNDRSGPDCRVKLMTDGILLKELESDPKLLRYDTLIIDEAHERSLNIDLLLGVLKRILVQRRDLKLIVTSATIDPDKFARFFGGAPVIEVSGRSYPVEVRYRALEGDEDAVELSLPEGIVAAVEELDAVSRGDVLVFLPGEKQIREADAALGKAKLMNTEILPLFSRLSARDQERIFEGHTARRVVLATNVAETSLTVPGIRNVVDSGLARISRYSVRGKVQRLPIEKIAKASADQRKGRCGRESPGVCIRLFSEEDFESREAFTPPEVLRTNLASVILRLAVLGLGDPTEFPFLDPPDTRLINDGYRLLQELKAVDDDRRVTALGRQIASLPVDPRLARMLIAASHQACLAEMLIVASFLEIQDPRERPVDAQTQADQAHATFDDPRSDFIAVLNLWQAFQSRTEELSGSQLRKWCREHYLSFVRMREWQELHRQLKEAVEEIELRSNTQAADYAGLHQAILTGFLGQIGALDEKREYLGARGTRFTVAPGTPLASKPPKWIVAGSIVETTRVFARMVASVEPQWIERAGEHLLKRSYTEPQWVEHKGIVGAYESVSLYGLVLAAQRRINYGTVMPKYAREIFVREALVEGRSTFRTKFLEHNANVRAQVDAMEAKIRRRDILVDEQTLSDFYLRRLPESMHSIAGLQKWLREKGAAVEETLKMSMSDVTRRQVPEITADRFPDRLVVGGNELALSYKFEPQQADDGSTLTVPEPLVSVVNAESVTWAIPGWHMDRVTAILRALPKDQRKAFVPVPDAAIRCLEELHAQELNNATLAAWISKHSGIAISAEQVAQLPIPDYLRMNFRVVRLNGQRVGEGRDLVQLRRQLRAQPATAGRRSDSDENHRTWDFGELPVERSIERRGVTFTVYPSLRPDRDGVTIVEFGSLQEAEEQLRWGVLRLAQLALPQQVKLAQKAFTDRRDLVLLGQGMGHERPLAASFVDRVFLNCMLGSSGLPRSRAEFEAMLDAGRARIGDCIDKLAVRVTDILQAVRAVRQQVSALNSSHPEAIADVQRQLDTLLPPGFISTTPDPWFEHLHRYLRAIERRLQRLPSNAKRDADARRTLVIFDQALAELHGKAVQHTELDKFRWMLQEYRVSIFAQELKTAMPVSEKRLAEQLQRAREEAAR